jgi:hypothetical protein
MGYVTRETLAEWGSLQVRVSYNQGSFEIHGTEYAVLFDPYFRRFGDAVEAQVVLLFVNLGYQSSFKGFVLHLVHPAFEDRLLHTLAHTLANPGDTAQTPAASSSFRGDVVGDDDEHGYVYFVR